MEGNAIQRNGLGLSNTDYLRLSGNMMFPNAISQHKLAIEIFFQPLIGEIKRYKEYFMMSMGS